MKIPCIYFLKDFKIIFLNFYKLRNQEIKLNMPKNYGINIFDFEGPLSLTHTICAEYFADLPSILSTFHARVFCTKFGGKNYKAAWSSFIQNFGAQNVLRTKNGRIKCRWNWHWGSMSSTFFCARFSYESSFKAKT